MQDPWDAIANRLSALRRTRMPLRDRSGDVFVADDTGLREQVFLYVVQSKSARVPVEILSQLIRDIDARLREESQSGEVAWLEAVCDGATGLPISRIGELSMQHFDLHDDPIMEWFRFDKMVGSLVHRVGVWRSGASPTPASIVASDTPPPLRRLKQTELKLIRPLISASTPMIAKELTDAAGLKYNAYYRGMLKSLQDEGFIRRAPKGNGYALAVNPASILLDAPDTSPDTCQGDFVLKRPDALENSRRRGDRAPLS